MMMFNKYDDVDKFLIPLEIMELVILTDKLSDDNYQSSGCGHGDHLILTRVLITITTIMLIIILIVIIMPIIMIMEITMIMMC